MSCVDILQEFLRNFGLNNIKIIVDKTRKAWSYTGQYSYKNNAITISNKYAYENTVYSNWIAAHEVGHALQHGRIMRSGLFLVFWVLKIIGVFCWILLYSIGLYVDSIKFYVLLIIVNIILLKCIAYSALQFWMDIDAEKKAWDIMRQYKLLTEKDKTHTRFYKSQSDILFIFSKSIFSNRLEIILFELWWVLYFISDKLVIMI